MNQPRPVCLTSIEVLQEVEVIGFLKGGRIAHRLAELGITPRTRLTVLQSRPGQPMLIRVRGSHLAIDRGIADQLQVRRLRRTKHRRPGHHKARRAGRHHQLNRIKAIIQGDDSRERSRGWRKRRGRRKRSRRRFLEYFFNRREAENQD